jgi:polysaccharide biosynthesis protein PslH
MTQFVRSTVSAIAESPRPHVLYVTPIFGYPPFGGPRLRTYNTLRALSRCADVSLYVTDLPDVEDVQAARAHVLTFCRWVHWSEPPVPPRGWRRVANAVLRRAIPRSLRERLSHQGTSRTSSTLNATVAKGESLIDELAHLARESQVDVLWFGFGSLLYHLAPLKEVVNKPLVIETESVWSRFILRALPFESNPRRKAEIVAQGNAKEDEERWGTNFADVTTAVSEVDAEYYRSITTHPERVLPVANVIDVDAYAGEDASVQGPMIAEPSVCFPGTFHGSTGNVDAAIWLLDRVMPAVWARLPDLTVYFVGRHPAPALVARREKRVIVTGEVLSVLPYLQRCTATVVPLRWESGTRFKILEAFATGSPVISTTLGAEGLDVEHGKHLLLADEPEAFAESIVTLVEDQHQRDSLSAAARKLVQEQYGLDAAERQVAAVLARVGFPTVVPAYGG